MLVFLDYFLTVFHTLFVLFVLFGWIHPFTRKMHLVAIGLTLVAWLLIGLYKGVLGYCPLTDWHWDLKRALGERNMPGSFIEYIIEEITGVNFSSKLVDAFTVGGLVCSIVMALVVNVLTKKIRK